MLWTALLRKIPNTFRVDLTDVAAETTALIPFVVACGGRVCCRYECVQVYLDNLHKTVTRTVSDLSRFWILKVWLSRQRVCRQGINTSQYITRVKFEAQTRMCIHVWAQQENLTMLAPNLERQRLATSVDVLANMSHRSKSPEISWKSLENPLKILFFIL